MNPYPALNTTVQFWIGFLVVPLILVAGSPSCGAAAAEGPEGLPGDPFRGDRPIPRLTLSARAYGSLFGDGLPLSTTDHHGIATGLETKLRVVSTEEQVRLVDYYPLPLHADWIYEGLDWDGHPAKSVRRVEATNVPIALCSSTTNGGRKASAA